MWITTEATRQGQAVMSGRSTKKAKGTTTSPEATATSVVAIRGSTLILSMAFHPAWHAAAMSTATKTKGSIALEASMGTGIVRGRRQYGVGHVSGIGPHCSSSIRLGAQGAMSP